MIALALVACGPAPRTWPPLDDAELQARLDNPTAPLPDPDAIAEELRDILQAGGDLESVPATLDPVLADPGTEKPPPDEEGDEELISGTSAFFDVACPGTGSVPDPDFASGLMRIEGPFLLEDGSLPVLGPLFLTFGACELGDSVVDGEMRARWNADAERLLAVGDVSLLVDGVELAWNAVLAYEPTGLSLSYAIPSGTVTLAFGTDSVQVTFADGVAVCTRVEPVTCVGLE